MDANDRLLTMKEVVVLTRMSKPTVYKLIREGRFPQQIRICDNKVAWLQSEILDWISRRAEARTEG